MMNKFFLGLTVSIIIVAIFLAFFVKNPQEPQPVSIEIAPPVRVQQPTETPPPAPKFPVAEPIPQEQARKPLPTLDESDSSVEEEFNQLVTKPQQSDLLLFKTFIRNFVVIIDNMTSRILPQKYYFFQPPPGKFMVTVGADETIYLDPENYKRYNAFVDLVQSLDLDQLIRIYTYLYPLFQEAYMELGYPDAYFNDRLIEVITNLLQTPEVQQPVVLVQPTVYYKFADPDLEALGTGQKLLIRIGPQNAVVIKSRLQALKEKLTALDGNQR